MRFSENEVEALVHVTGSESTLYLKDISHDFGLRPETVSRTTTRLREKGLLERNGWVSLVNSLHRETDPSKSAARKKPIGKIL